MAQIRITEEGLQARRAEIVRLNGEIRELEIISKEKESPLWLRLGPGIRRAIEANREKMEELLSRESTVIDKNGNMIAVDPVADLAAAKALAGAIKFGKMVLEQVEVEKSIENKRARAQYLKDELEKITEEQTA